MSGLIISRLTAVSEEARKHAAQGEYIRRRAIYPALLLFSLTQSLTMFLQQILALALSTVALAAVSASTTGKEVAGSDTFSAIEREARRLRQCQRRCPIFTLMRPARQRGHLSPRQSTESRRHRLPSPWNR
jgi:hypothetical protein